MIRTCNGQDPNLLDGPCGGPCACGLVFDDVRRSTIHPHVFIPTHEEKAKLLATLEEIFQEPVPASPGSTG